MTKQMMQADTGAWEYDLLAAVIQRAILDATKGDGEVAEQAAAWLDSIWPSWREMSCRSLSADCAANRTA